MDEPNAVIRWTIFYFAGGAAGICGAVSLASIVIVTFSRGCIPRIRPFWFLIGIVISLVFMACGSLPLPIWFQFVTLVWLIFVLSRMRFRAVKDPLPAEQQVAPTIAVRYSLLPASAFAWLIAVTIIEVPSHFPTIPANSISTLLVIGDSVTAGLNDGEDTWPRQLSHAAKVDVLDASQPGATLRSARKQNEALSGAPGMVILEIGGNDMLEGLHVAKFEDDLEHLLNDVAQSGRTVLMFELPLPPFSSAYGLAQRRLARRHKVILIPKGRFASILTTRHATVDGIHLSKQGQLQMMAAIRQLLGSRLATGIGTWQRIE